MRLLVHEPMKTFHRHIDEVACSAPGPYSSERIAARFKGSSTWCWIGNTAGDRRYILRLVPQLTCGAMSAASRCASCVVLGARIGGQWLASRRPRSQAAPLGIGAGPLHRRWFFVGRDAPARAPASIDMLQIYQRPPSTCRGRCCRRIRDVAGPAGGADLADDGEDHTLGLTPRRGRH
jgi:hypothetical protein